MNDAAALQEEIVLLRERLSTEKEKIAASDAQIAVLNEQIKYLPGKHYGSSSEKISPNPLGLFNATEVAIVDAEIEEAENTTVKSHSPTR